MTTFLTVIAAVYVIGVLAVAFDAAMDVLIGVLAIRSMPPSDPWRRKKERDIREAWPKLCHAPFWPLTLAGVIRDARRIARGDDS